MQGRAVLGGRLSPPRRYVFATCDRPDYRYETVRSVRDNRYRYVLNLSKRKAELFDSNGDPNEVNDISAANKELTERLHKRWEQWRDETRDLGLIPEADLANREAAFGTRYAAGRQAGFDSLLQRLSTAVPADSTEWITDSDAAIRYRACSTASEAMLRKLLSDPSGAVRVQAALLLRQRNSGYAADAMKVLLRALRSGEEWLRMQAALALEEIGDKDLAVLNALQAVAKSDKNRAVATVAARATKGSA
jgi:N-sulfoglucosamine sulfohydrolase